MRGSASCSSGFCGGMENGCDGLGPACWRGCSVAIHCLGAARDELRLPRLRRENGRRGMSFSPVAPIERAVCVYCASSRIAHPDYRAAARRLGEVLADEGVGIVYGGG